MEIKRSSWHYKLFKRFNYDKEPISLCSYFWSIIFLAFVLAPFDLILRGLLGLLQVAGRYIWQIIASICGYHAVLAMYKAQISGNLGHNLLEIISVAGFISAVIVLLGGLLFFLDHIPVVSAKVKDIVASTEIWKLSYGYFRAVKDRVCPLITLVD